MHLQYTIKQFLTKLVFLRYRRWKDCFRPKIGRQNSLRLWMFLLRSPCFFHNFRTFPVTMALLPYFKEVSIYFYIMAFYPTIIKIFILISYILFQVYLWRLTFPPSFPAIFFESLPCHFAYYLKNYIAVYD